MTYMPVCVQPYRPKTSEPHHLECLLQAMAPSSSQLGSAVLNSTFSYGFGSAEESSSDFMVHKKKSRKMSAPQRALQYSAAQGPSEAQPALGLSTPPLVSGLSVPPPAAGLSEPPLLLQGQEYPGLPPLPPPVFGLPLPLGGSPLLGSSLPPPAPGQPLPHTVSLSLFGFADRQAPLTGHSCCLTSPLSFTFKRKQLAPRSTRTHDKQIPKKRFVPPSWSSLSSLQSQEGYWLLNEELGASLKINVHCLKEDFLVKKGITSLGIRGIDMIHKLIATLLVLQLIRAYCILREVTFKTLMKLDQSVPKSLYPSIEKAIEWAMKCDRQYPGICMRLGLGKDWEQATRYILHLDTIPTTCDLFSVSNHLFL